MAVWIDSSEPAERAGAGGIGIRRGPCGDHLAHVVVKLNQIDEDRPLDFQQQVLLVVLQLGVQAVDHSLAAGLGAKLALEGRSQGVDSPAEVFAQLGKGVDATSGSLGDGEPGSRRPRPASSAAAGEPVAAGLPGRALRARRAPGHPRGRRTCLRKEKARLGSPASGASLGTSSVSGIVDPFIFAGRP